MKFKRIITILVAILIFYFGFMFAMKKYVYPYKYAEYVNKYSEEYELDPYLVLAVIKTESDFDKTAVSKKDAKGLMQIMDTTGEWVAKEIGINYFMTSMMFDPELNIKIGCWYLKNLKEEFNNNLDLVLAAYNGGSGNVNKWLSHEEYSTDGENLDYIPFPETKKYVNKVKVNYNIYRYLYDK
ncbi:MULTISPECIES: lytic transglycosylase domain-containing protein [unclassified Clostridium]|jgi:transglycosylase SLT domain-containing protein|uniref:lytic transglycosylase domain-containing protein n=1 Tax=unclassified Clostridium TaxID=2614128 RepID=UPI0025BFD4BF|nr:lytic transglycosylase domain-containing protein [Clostridium sp.]MCI6693385.1 lytic transglycosylase domain-containing protein [Clostridium sp.]MDY2632735.1 lytic transglycosylase domain-containing protein [Clostridium sp.]MDY4253492.1 lytic transglycosylase domain-containing protein [Clostridium sp.]MDY6228137.1 lytic transglycosylase domain-containing protein [Clostridium sp.]